MAGPQQKPNTLLRNARLAAGLSQSQLAEKIGVDAKSVQRWETGKTTPRPSLLRALCDALAKTPAELGFGYPEEAQSGKEDQPTLQQAEQEQYQEKQKQDAFPLPMPLERRSSLPLGRRIFRLLIGLMIILIVAISVGRAVILRLNDCGQSFSGAFQDRLDTRWQFVNPTGHGIWQIDPQGSLSITAPRGSDLNSSPDHGHNLNAPRLLQSITGDFTIQTHLQVHFTAKNFQSATPFQSAGLLLWQDEHTFLRFERFLGPLNRSPFNGILFQQAKNNAFLSINPLTDHPTS